MVEGSGLENRRAGNGTVGSNPTLSARRCLEQFPNAKKVDNSEKDPCGSFLFAKGLTKSTHTQRGFEPHHPCKHPKEYGTFYSKHKTALKSL